MLEPFATSHRRWSLSAFALLVIAACGGRTSSTNPGTGNGGGSGTNGGATTGTASGASLGTVSVITSGTSSGTLTRGSVVGASGTTTSGSAGSTSGAVTMALPACPTPTFMPPAGAIAPGSNVVITAAGLPAGGEILFTIDGTIPTRASPAYNAGTVGIQVITVSETFNAISSTMGATCTDSAVASAWYIMELTPLSEGGPSGPVPPSCGPGGPGMTNCGPGGSGTESCCTSLEVSGGTYYRTYMNDGSGATGEVGPATVSSFRLDKYDVTVGRFRQFVGAVLPLDGGVGWLPPPGSGKHTHLNGGLGLVNVGSDAGAAYEPGWVDADDSNVAPTDANLACETGTWTNSPGTQESLPIDCVNWYEAYAFCIWDGGFLPSDAEWLYAAVGGAQQREYPWGSTDPGSMSQYAIYDCLYPNGGGLCTGVANVAAVGTATMGAGMWGQLDLVGDLEQWNIDSPDMFNYVEPCVDCTYISGATARVTRGTGFGQPNAFENGNPVLQPFLVTGDEAPTTRDAQIGFRCARTP